MGEERMTSPHPDPQGMGQEGAAASAGLGSEAAGMDSAASGESAAAGGAYDPRRKVAAKDEARLALVILRDVALIAVFLSLFAGAESWSTISRLKVAKILSVVDGLLVGVAIAALAHEWGHLLGARLGGGHAPLKPISQFLPLYDYDYTRNDARSFLWMSYGGNIAHASIVVLLWLLVPTRSMGPAALVAGAFGFAVFSSLVEIPVIQQARRGVPALEALGSIPKNFVSKYLPWSLAAAFGAYAAL